MYKRRSPYSRQYGRKRFGSQGGERLLGLLVILSILGGIGLCIWQFATSQPQNQWIGLAFIAVGAPFLIGAIVIFMAASWREEIGGCVNFGFLTGGIAAVTIGSLIIFAPDVGLSQRITNIYQPGLREKDLLMDVRVEPASYIPGESGIITVSVQNIGESAFTLEDLSFDVKSVFFDGFIISYPTRPELKDRTNKIGGYTGLFFKMDPVALAPGESYQVEVDIVANIPGDYSSRFGMLVQATQKGKALKLFTHIEEINVIILPK